MIHRSFDVSSPLCRLHHTQAYISSQSCHRGAMYQVQCIMVRESVCGPKWAPIKNLKRQNLSQSNAASIARLRISVYGQVGSMLHCRWCGNDLEVSAQTTDHTSHTHHPSSFIHISTNLHPTITKQSGCDSSHQDLSFALCFTTQQHQLTELLPCKADLPPFHPPENHFEVLKFRAPSPLG